MNKTALLFVCLSLFHSYSCQQEQIVHLKIMSFNIRHGEGLDGVLDLSRSAEVIASQAPDLCGLQEIDNYCERTDSVGQTEFLAQKTSTTGIFGKFMEYQGGEYGMATLSSKQLISTKVLELPDGKYEPRSSIVHEVEIAKDCIISFANVHFDWISEKEGSTNRLKQAKTLVKYINTLGNATIITGDFNCTPDSPTMEYFTEQGFIFIEKGADSLSFQGDEKAEIDHVIYRNTDKVKFKVKHIVLLNEPVVSDHRPLVAELEVVYYLEVD